ncbi:hypothetical protein D3C81_2288680 [compost metagenome]
MRSVGLMTVLTGASSSSTVTDSMSKDWVWGNVPNSFTVSLLDSVTVRINRYAPVLLRNLKLIYPSEKVASCPNAT